MSNIRLYRCDEFRPDCEKIATWAEPFGFVNVYPIIRGGLFVGTQLSYLLDIPILCPTEVDRIGRNTLVAEDIVDKGETLILLENRLGWMPTVTALFVAEEARRQPAYAVHRKTDWTQFFWETGETSKYDGTFRKFLEAHPKQ